MSFDIQKIDPEDHKKIHHDSTFFEEGGEEVVNSIRAN